MISACSAITCALSCIETVRSCSARRSASYRSLRSSSSCWRSRSSSVSSLSFSLSLVCESLSPRKYPPTGNSARSDRGVLSPESPSLSLSLSDSSAGWIGVERAILVFPTRTLLAIDMRFFFFLHGAPDHQYTCVCASTRVQALASSEERTDLYGSLRYVASVALA